MQPLYRLIKVVFYLTEIIAVILGIFIGKYLGLHQQCTYSLYSYAPTCYEVGSTSREWVFAILGGFIAWFAMEIVKAIGIYVVHGTGISNQKTFFAETYASGGKKKQ